MQELVGIVRTESDMLSGLEEVAKLQRRARNVAVQGNREYNSGWHTALVWMKLMMAHRNARVAAGEERTQENYVSPGFRELILARRAMGSAELEAHNRNLVGGDLNGGAMDLGQLLFRPARKLVPYRTPLRGVYLCSASTPPGGGVHGMCGYSAARVALADLGRRNRSWPFRPRPGTVPGRGP